MWHICILTYLSFCFSSSVLGQCWWVLVVFFSFFSFFSMHCHLKRHFEVRILLHMYWFSTLLWRNYCAKEQWFIGSLIGFKMMHNCKKIRKSYKVSHGFYLLATNEVLKSKYDEDLINLIVRSVVSQNYITLLGTFYNIISW